MKNFRNLLLLAPLTVALMGLSATTASATPVNVTFGFNADSTHAATAAFSIVSGKLQIVLTNTSSGAALVPTDVLTAVFFNLNNGVTLSATLTGNSAVIGAGGSIVNPAKCNTAFVSACTAAGAGFNVGGEWASGSSLTFPLSANSGVSSSGLSPASWFGAANMNGTNLQDPAASVDGLQFGIVSSSYATGGGNTGVNKSALIRNSVVLTLGLNIPTNAIVDIDKVTFQYGTSNNEPEFQGSCVPGQGPYANGGCAPAPPPPPPTVPEPISLICLGVGLVGLGLVRRRQQQ